MLLVATETVILAVVSTHSRPGKNVGTKSVSYLLDIKELIGRQAGMQWFVSKYKMVVGQDELAIFGYKIAKGQ